MKYRRSTLQLPSGTERPTFAWAKVDVLERIEGELVPEHESEVIPS